MGFSVPIREWLRGPLRRLPEEVLLDRHSIDRGWFSADRIRSLIRDHQDGSRDNSSKLWALLQLELWLRSYVDEPTPRPIALAGR
jgi:asparagine synthase (glutamine-hydrolysing)